MQFNGATGNLKVGEVGSQAKVGGPFENYVSCDGGMERSASMLLWEYSGGRERAAAVQPSSRSRGPPRVPSLCGVDTTPTGVSRHKLHRVGDEREIFTQ